MPDERISVGQTGASQKLLRGQSDGTVAEVVAVSADSLDAASTTALLEAILEELRLIRAIQAESAD